MPWKKVSVMDERLRFVARILEGEPMTDLCREFGISRKTGYKIFNTFPLSYIGATIDVCTASVIVPLGPRRTEIVFYIFLWPGSPPELGERLLEFNQALFREDLEACQTWETAVAQLRHPPVLGRLEERVAWFRDAYREVVGS